MRRRSPGSRNSCSLTARFVFLIHARPRARARFSSFYREITRRENVAIVSFGVHSFSVTALASLARIPPRCCCNITVPALRYFYRQVSLPVPPTLSPFLAFIEKIAFPGIHTGGKVIRRYPWRLHRDTSREVTRRSPNHVKAINAGSNELVAVALISDKEQVYWTTSPYLKSNIILLYWIHVQ